MGVVKKFPLVNFKSRLIFINSLAVIMKIDARFRMSPPEQCDKLQGDIFNTKEVIMDFILTEIRSVKISSVRY